MLLAAACAATAVVLLAAVVPARLTGAAWARRSPTAGLLLWQAVGLAGGVLAVEALVTAALAPAGDSHAAAVRAVAAGAGLPWWSYAGLALAAALLLRLLGVLVGSAARTLRARHRNRVLVDLVATRNPLLARTRVVDHAVPVAYCLPGLRPRVVLSRGVLDLLREDEVRAVLAHENAHVEQRHDLVVLPFVALGATFPRLPAVRTAQAEVGLLVEMLADDRATRRHPRDVLARALWKVGTASVPAGGLGVGGPGAAGGGDGVLLRAQRLLAPPDRLGPAARVAVTCATAAVLALPVAALVLPLAG